MRSGTYRICPPARLCELMQPARVATYLLSLELDYQLRRNENSVPLDLSSHH